MADIIVQVFDDQVIGVQIPGTALLIPLVAEAQGHADDAAESAAEAAAAATSLGLKATLLLTYVAEANAFGVYDRDGLFVPLVAADGAMVATLARISTATVSRLVSAGPVAFADQDGLFAMELREDGRTLVADAHLYRVNGASAEVALSRPEPAYKPRELANLPYFTATGWNHALGYGQSLSLGRATAFSPSVLNSTPSNRHMTFNVGVSMTKPGLAGGANDDDGDVKALVAEVINPEGGGNCGETPLWMAAATAAAAMAEGGESVPTIFASTAAHGGYTLSQLDVGADWYNNLKYHVEAANDAATVATVDYGVSFVLLDLGQADQSAATATASIVSDLTALIANFQTYVEGVTGQTEKVQWLCSTTPAEILTGSGYSEAIMELADELDDLHFVMNGAILYRKPSDTLHVSSESYALTGACYGPAMARCWRGYEPERVRWGTPTAIGTTLTVTCDCPADLVIDTAIVPPVNQYGLAVQDDTGLVALNDIVVEGRTITATLARELDPNPELRFGLDADWAGSPIPSGATGNIFAASDETVTINGTVFHLAHLAPITRKTIEILETGA